MPYTYCYYCTREDGGGHQEIDPPTFADVVLWYQLCPNCDAHIEIDEDIRREVLNQIELKLTKIRCLVWKALK